MVKRVPNEEKIKCVAVFNLSIDIPFSLSMQKSKFDKFQRIVANRNSDVSKKLRDFVYARIGFMSRNPKKELNEMSEKAINLEKETIYNKLGINRKMSFSEMIAEDVDKYTEEEET